MTTMVTDDQTMRAPAHRSLRMTAAVAVTLVLAACGGTVEQSTPASELTATSDAQATTEVSVSSEEPVATQTDTTTATTTTTTTTTTTMTTTTTQPPIGLDPGSPIPVGDPEVSGFTYEEDYADAAWDGFVFGLVETGVGQYNDDPGRCLVLLGTVTPTSTEGAVSNSFNTPNFSIIVNGSLVDGGVSDCDTDAIEANGFGWILDASVTAGTTYPFYSEFFIPDSAGRDPEVVVVGSATGSDALYFEPTILTEIPVPDTGPGTPSGVNRTPVGDPEVSGFTYEEDYADAAWDGFVFGLVETGVGQYNDDPGRCLVLLGTVTPTSTEGAVSNSFNTPNFSIIVNGSLVDGGVSDCDTDAIEANGFGWILDASVTAGTTYPFYSEFFIPDSAGRDPEVVVVGSATGSDALYFEPTILTEIPVL